MNKLNVVLFSSKNSICILCTKLDLNNASTVWYVKMPELVMFMAYHNQ